MNHATTEGNFMKNLARAGVLALGAGLLTVVPVASASAVETTITPSSTQLDCANTRVDGHNVIEKKGKAERMHVYTGEVATVPSPDSRKAACDVDIPNASLAYVGFPDLNWSFKKVQPPYQPIQPGAQIVGSSDAGAFRLVAEPVYGDDIWAANESSAMTKQLAPSCDGTPDAVTDPASHCTGGSGSYWHGTAAEWDAALANNGVDKLGWSLGSGVTADGYIPAIDYGSGDQVDFSVTDPPPVVTNVSPYTSLETGLTATCRQVVIHVELPDLGPNQQYSPSSINYRVTSGGQNVKAKTAISEGGTYDVTLTYPKASGSVVAKVFRSTTQTGAASTLESQIAVNRNCNTVGGGTPVVVTS